MGNVNSTNNQCPPFCRALCWGQAPAGDEGEWFEETRRQNRRKSKKKARSQRNLNPMPVVPEESACSETIDTNEENGASLLEPSEPELDTDDSLQEAKPKGSAKTSILGRAKSESSALARSNSTRKRRSKPKRLPKTKLTFLNGQFIDLSTKEGQEMAKKAEAAEEEGPGPIAGILTSVKAGHCGILPPSSEPTKEKSSSSLNSYAVKTLSKLGSVSRGKSTDSTSSLDSVSTQGSLPTSLNGKDAVCSIVVLGEGYILTASKCDRAIKMWRVESTDGNASVVFVRDFVGHHVGVTCLAKVDDKGRFLSASKDRAVHIWDSRFNCNDSSEDANEHKILLACFSDMDRRSIHSIAITDDGSYVRPTDKIDLAMAAAMAKKTMKDGSGSVQKAARERHILACSCSFATITGRHKVVKQWSTKHVETEEDLDVPNDGNVAEVKLEQELKHDAVVESIVAMRRKGLLLTGDRMGIVRLWHSVKNVFLPGSARIWSCERTFSWRKDSLSTVTETFQFAVTSLAFLPGNAAFVSGSKSGNLRVWNVDGTKSAGETVTKELICITGAHSEVITVVQQGPNVGGGNISFSSASEDGKVLSFALATQKDGVCNPCCFNAVNHGIANRYVVAEDPVAVTALASLRLHNNNQDLLVSSSTDGNINVLRARSASNEEQTDALVLYRQLMEEESLTLHAIAWEMCNEGGVEIKSRKSMMKTYKDCFTGNDAVSYLVDNRHAASRKDAVDLGQVLLTHLSLYECASKKGASIEDDAKAFYRFRFEGDGRRNSAST